MPASPQLQAALDALGAAVDRTLTIRTTISTARTEGDERVCLTCRRRWGLSEDLPNCERGCNAR